MPNYVRTRISFNKRANEIRNFVKGEDSAFDFNKVIPMPEELDITSGSVGTYGMEYLLATAKHPSVRTESDKKVIEFVSKQPDFNEWVELGKKYLSNTTKYGCPTWHEWRNANWNTKWNACDAVDYTDDCDGDYGYIEFETAWDFCYPVVKRLSELFPDVEFEYVFADEDTSYNTGRGCYVNGEDISADRPDGSSKEAYEIYFDLWPEDEEYYEFNEDTGTYDYIEED